jgi:hypothetical protein
LSPESFLTSERVAGQPGAGVFIDLILGAVGDNCGKGCYEIIAQADPKTDRSWRCFGRRSSAKPPMKNPRSQYLTKITL